MKLEINWLAVAIATIAGMLIARAWYHVRAFGLVWRALTGVRKADSRRAGKMPMLITLISNFITATVLTVAINVCAVFFENQSVWLAILVGLVAWLAFSMTTLVTHNAFEQKASKLTCINNGYQLFLFAGMALVIGLLA